MIRDDQFPEEMSKESSDKNRKRARWATLPLAAGGGVVYAINRVSGAEGREKAYKRLKRGSIGLSAGSIGILGLSEYIHYKHRKKLREDDSNKKN